MVRTRGGNAVETDTELDELSSAERQIAKKRRLQQKEKAAELKIQKRLGFEGVNDGRGACAKSLPSKKKVAAVRPGSKGGGRRVKALSPGDVVAAKKGVEKKKGRRSRKTEEDGRYEESGRAVDDSDGFDDDSPMPNVQTGGENEDDEEAENISTLKSTEEEEATPKGGDESDGELEVDEDAMMTTPPARGPMIVSKTRLTPRGPLIVSETKVTAKVNKELRKCKSAREVFAIAERVRAEAKEGEPSPMDVETGSPKEVVTSPVGASPLHGDEPDNEFMDLTQGRSDPDVEKNGGNERSAQGNCKGVTGSQGHNGCVDGAGDDDEVVFVGEVKPRTVSSDEEVKEEEAVGADEASDAEIDRVEEGSSKFDSESESGDEDEAKAAAKDKKVRARTLVRGERAYYCEASRSLLGRLEDCVGIGDEEVAEDEHLDVENVISEAYDFVVDTGPTSTTIAFMVMRLQAVSLSNTRYLYRKLQQIERKLDNNQPRTGTLAGCGEVQGEMIKTGSRALKAEPLMSVIKKAWIDAGYEDKKVASGSWSVAVKVCLEKLGSSEDSLEAMFNASFFRYHTRTIEQEMTIESAAYYVSHVYETQTLVLRFAGAFYAEEFKTNGDFRLFSFSSLYMEDQVDLVVEPATHASMATVGLVRETLRKNAASGRHVFRSFSYLCSYESPENRAWVLCSSPELKRKCPLTLEELVGPEYLTHNDLVIKFIGDVDVESKKGIVKRKLNMLVNACYISVLMYAQIHLPGDEGRRFTRQFIAAEQQMYPVLITTLAMRRGGKNKDFFIKIVHGGVVSMFKLLQRSVAGALTKDDADMFHCFDFSEYGNEKEKDKYDANRTFSAARYHAMTGIDVDVDDTAAQAPAPQAPGPQAPAPQAPAPQVPAPKPNRPSAADMF